MNRHLFKEGRENAYVKGREVCATPLVSALVRGDQNQINLLVDPGQTFADEPLMTSSTVQRPRSQTSTHAEIIKNEVTLMS